MINNDHLERMSNMLNDRFMDDVIEALEEYCEKHGLNINHTAWHIHVGLNPDILGSQPPLCDCYDPSGAALAMWPSGKVQLFPDLPKALTMLPRQHYIYVVKTPNEAWALYQSYGDEYQKRLQADDEHVADAAHLWQYLLDIAEERNPWAQVTAGSSDSTRLSKRATAAGYKVSHDKCKTMADAKAPKQAKVLATSFLEFDDGGVVQDEDIQRLLQKKAAQGVLKTKQDVMRIFAYYRKALLEHGAIELRT